MPLSVSGDDALGDRSDSCRGARMALSDRVPGDQLLQAFVINRHENVQPVGIEHPRRTIAVFARLIFLSQ